MYYFDRGIRVCDEWDDFDAFRSWAIVNGYDDSLELDRREANGNYEPGNCRWATKAQQAQNRRKAVGGKSRFKGVARHARPGRVGWRAVIWQAGRNKHLGTFRTELEAALTYDRAASATFGEFACINFAPARRV